MVKMCGSVNVFVMVAWYAHWELLLYLFDDVYVNVVVGGGKVLLDLVIEKGGKGLVVGRGWW